MDVNYINPFLEAFVNVMPQLGLNDVKKVDVELRGRFIESPGIVVIIGLIGDIKGNIIYGMTEEDAKKIASVMMMGMPIASFDELAQSAISELINMLTANVATKFSEQSINMNISTPTLIQGVFMANANSDKVICVKMSVDGCIMDINISLEKNTI